MEISGGVLSIILIIIGLIGVLAGYKAFKIYLAISAFIFGFFLGSKLLLAQDDIVIFVGSIIIGLILGGISYLVYKLAVFLVFAAITYELSTFAIANWGWDLGTYADITIIAFSVIVGLVFIVLKVEKLLLIFLTSLIGSSYILIGALSLNIGNITIGNINLINQISVLIGGQYMYLIMYIALVAFGIYIQLRSSID